MELALGRTVMMQQAPGVAASSECSSGCQSGWTTYLDDDDDDDGDRSSSRSSSCGTNRHFARAKAAHQFHCHDHYSCSEEDDLSMISDASSGPRHHQKCSNDAGQAGGAAASSARRRVADAAATRRQSKKAAAAALLEDTASSPAFLGYSKATHLFEEATSVYGYGAGTDEPMMMEMANAADFSCAFSATTTAGFKSPLNGTALDGYLQMQYSPAAAKTMMHTAQVCRDAGETTQRW